MELPGKSECCWAPTAPETAYPQLQGSGSADVAVVGAGIVGLTAAYILSSAGLSVVVLEARQVGRQLTGRSTAKITSQHALIYRHLIETFNLDMAQRYADANRTASQQIRRWIEDLGAMELSLAPVAGADRASRSFPRRLPIVHPISTAAAEAWRGRIPDRVISSDDCLALFGRNF